MPQTLPRATAESMSPRQTIHYAPSSIANDPLQYLPPLAAERLRMLMQRVNDLRNLCPEHADLQAANVAKLGAAARLKRLTDKTAEGGFSLDISDHRVVLAEKQLADATDAAVRLTNLDVVRSKSWRDASNVLSATESWLAQGRPANTELQDYDLPQPPLKNGEGIADGIARLRARADELKLALDQIRAAKFPAAHAKARMRNEIERLAERGKPDVTPLLQFEDGEIAFATERVRSDIFNVPGGAIAFAQQPAVLPLFCWTFKAALISALDAEIALHADDQHVLSSAERQRREADILAQLLQTERDECALVWMAQAQGLPIEHRNDVGVVPLLSVELVTARHADPSGSSWMHSYEVVQPG
jgi:hypothetical protein